MKEIKKRSSRWDEVSGRIIADHLRASVFLIVDGVLPSNTDRGYVLRKLLRRAIRKQKEIDLNVANLFKLVPYLIEAYKGTNYGLEKFERHIMRVLGDEGGKFTRVLHEGDIVLVDLIKKAKSEGKMISGEDTFTLYSSYGFPIEETIKIAKSKGVEVDIESFKEEFKKHQKLSRAGAEKKFKGGLADAGNPIVVKYHTATHLLHQALHDVLGEGVAQRGSNITAERLRFDFSHGAKMTDEEKKKVESIVNEKIQAKLSVNQVIIPRAEAEKTGARHFFGEKYGDEISIYYIGDTIKNAYSKEFCGGPHVKNTGELGIFKIQKEEAVSVGIRRIKAVLV